MNNKQNVGTVERWMRIIGGSLAAVVGVILIGMGLYFVFLRPSLLPEDLRFMGVSLSTIQITAPTLLIWLRRVFWVLGASLFTSGLLTLYLALTSLRTRARGVSGVIALAGLTSVGWMSVVNFLIDSDLDFVHFGESIGHKAASGVR